MSDFFSRVESDPPQAGLEKLAGWQRCTGRYTPPRQSAPAKLASTQGGTNYHRGPERKLTKPSDQALSWRPRQGRTNQNINLTIGVTLYCRNKYWVNPPNNVASLSSMRVQKNVAPSAAESGRPNNVAPHFSMFFSVEKPNLALIMLHPTDRERSIHQLCTRNIIRGGGFF